MLRDRQWHTAGRKADHRHPVTVSLLSGCCQHRLALHWDTSNGSIILGWKGKLLVIFKFYRRMKISLRSNKDTTYSLSGNKLWPLGMQKVGPVKVQLQQDSPSLPRGGNGGSYTGEHQTNQVHPNIHKICAPCSKVSKVEGQTWNKTIRATCLCPSARTRKTTAQRADDHLLLTLWRQFTALPWHFLPSRESGSFVRCYTSVTF